MRHLRWMRYAIAGAAVREILVRDLAEATARCESASETFNATSDHLRNGISHPDGAQRIYNASRMLTVDRMDATSIESSGTRLDRPLFRISHAWMTRMQRTLPGLGRGGLLKH